MITRLLEAGRAQDAWHHCLRILEEDPKHVEALRQVQCVAIAAGAPRRAKEYARRLAAVLHTKTGGRRERSLNIRGIPMRLIQGDREDSGKYPVIRLGH